MKKYKCPFKKNQLVKFICPPNVDTNGYPFKNNEVVLFLGEIVQMKGHCIIVNNKGKVFYGYHTSDFEEPTEDEI